MLELKEAIKRQIELFKAGYYTLVCKNKMLSKDRFLYRLDDTNKDACQMDMLKHTAEYLKKNFKKSNFRVIRGGLSS